MAFFKFFPVAASLLMMSVTAGYSSEAPWDTVPNNGEKATLLLEALSNPANYDASVKNRICIANIFDVKQQLGNGINHKYVVAGCSIANDLPMSGCGGGELKCALQRYTVQFNLEPINRKFQVQSVQRLK